MWNRVLNVSEDHFFLFGPRGTGKSYWLKEKFPHSLYLDLLDGALYRTLLATPERIDDMIPPNYSGVVVLDEIQRVPLLLNEIHRLIEGRAKTQGLLFAMTGSSARKLRRKGVNLLAGRALTCRMHPMTALELGKDFNLTRTLRYGCLPRVLLSKNPKDFLESYVTTYLREEVQQEGLVRNLEGFSRFLEAASFSQGSPLNISSISSDCAVGRKAVEDYFQILEDLLLATRLQVFTRRAKRKLISAPKFYYFDLGVYRTIRPKGLLDSDFEVDGPSLETLVYQELKALNDYLHSGYAISYWRTTEDHEVDFILYGEHGLHAIEVTKTSRIRRADMESLQLFCEDYPQAKAYFVYGGTRKERFGPIEAWPVELFLRALPKLMAPSVERSLK
ncbi:MAG: ATP-binding protein [Deltaproteobacteria bacterium]|nr:ATP-binding protein [Deltaproteobacteria bacterium]